jgi:hypothetical protein
MAKGRKTGGRDIKPGQVLNPKGRPKLGTSYTDLLREKLPPDEFSEIVAKLVREGNESILRHVYDRFEGKVPDKHELTGEDGKDLNIEVVIKDVAD